MPTHRKLVTRHLEITLTDEEKQNACAEMAQAYAEKEDLEEEKRSTGERYKREIGGCEARIMRNGELVRNGYRFGDVKAEQIKDYELKTITVVRMDTGEEITKRPMDEEELQMEFPTEWKKDHPEPGDQGELEPDPDDGKIEGAE